MRSFLYFISGIGCGMGAALLMAPKSGAETRSTLRDSLSEGKGFIKDQMGQARDTVADTIGRSKEAVRSTGEGMVEAFERGKAAFRT